MTGWRLWLGLALLLAVAAATIGAGRWQLSRADEKRAIAEQVEAGIAQGPLALSPDVDPTLLHEWREAWARGYWQPGRTVLLGNRNDNGRPGFWVVTPLCLASPDAPEPPDANDAFGQAIDCDRAVAVLRGWVPRVIAAAPGGPAPSAEAVPPLPELPRYDTVEGRLLSHVPRLFDLDTLFPQDVEPQPLAWRDGAPVVQNLELEAYARATGLDLLPAVLQQTGGAADGLVRQWADPPVDIDKHLGYALQWFSFAAIALIAFGVILVKTFRSRRR